MLEVVYCKANGVMYRVYQRWRLFVWEEFQEKTDQEFHGLRQQI